MSFQFFNELRVTCRKGGPFLARTYISNRLIKLRSSEIQKTYNGQSIRKAWVRRKDIWVICRDYHIATYLGVETSKVIKYDNTGLVWFLALEDSSSSDIAPLFPRFMRDYDLPRLDCLDF